MGRRPGQIEKLVLVSSNRDIPSTREKTSKKTPPTKKKIPIKKKTTSSRNTFHAKILETARFLGPFLVKKDLAYGDATRKIIRCLKEYYPDGIPHDQIHNIYFMIQINNKFCRIATDNDPFGENPWLDIAGYSLLAYAKCKLEKNDKRIRKFNR